MSIIAVGGGHLPQDSLLVQSLQERGTCTEVFNDAKIFIAELRVFRIAITAGDVNDRSLEGTLLSFSTGRFYGSIGHSRRGNFSPFRRNL
jgi:hypothetical protein